MYFDKTKIGTNIRNLRKAYGETQKELGNIIGVADTTISMYESGTNIPDMETLQMIAEHYLITVEALLSDDFSGINMKNLKMSLSETMSLLRVMYPTVRTKENMKNELFAKAYKEHLDIWRRINKNDETLSNRSITRVIKKYVVSYQDTKNLESVANIVSLMILNYTYFPYKDIENRGQAIYYGKGEKKDFAKKYLLKDSDSIGIVEDEKQKERRNRYYNKVIKWIKLLKESSIHAELADYYIALLFIRNIVDNDNGATLNQKIGMDMMGILADLDNFYALSYIIKIAEMELPE